MPAAVRPAPVVPPAGRAAPAVPDADALAPRPAPAAALAPSRPDPLPAASAAPTAAEARPAAVAAAPVILAAVPATATPAPSRPERATAVPASAPLSEALPETVADAPAAAPAVPVAAAAPDRPPATLVAPAGVPAAPTAAAAAPDASPADALAAAGALAAAAALPAERMTAALAWSGAEGVAVDPASLAAIAAFTRTGDLVTPEDARLRDGIGGVLAAVPCARLQTAFDPMTGALELRGHIPEDGLRGPVLAALRDRIGPAIPVSDRVLILPRPQCSALSGIAAVGLPQSNDQASDPRVIGADAHVREYRYAAGQRLELDMEAPDYDAVIYVDFFDAAGNVIHLQPNAIVPLQRHAPRAALSVGRPRPDGGPALDITIGPPFGQEIVVAFAASRPLYDGLRPMVEPAGPYLDFLRQRVEAARAADPGFKGEWIYFFVTTTPG
jgi:hypothetical protein